MKCPRCGGSDDVVRSLSRERAGYVAAIICLACDRQVSVIKEEPGEAVDAAEELFFHGEGV